RTREGAPSASGSRGSRWSRRHAGRGGCARAPSRRRRRSRPSLRNRLPSVRDELRKAAAHLVAQEAPRLEEVVPHGRLAAAENLRDLAALLLLDLAQDENEALLLGENR